jgi:hypothetical protein
MTGAEQEQLIEEQSHEILLLQDEVRYGDSRQHIADSI